MSETTVSIGDSNGKVVLTFSQPTTNIVMEPENARQIGEGMARAAYTAKYGLKPQGKSVISDQKRMLLITRVTHVIRSLQDKGKLPGMIASQVVDTILSEVY